MHRALTLLVVAASVALANLAAMACAHAAPGAAWSDANPFASESQLALQYPRWDAIRDEHFAPAFEEGMRQHRVELDAIASNEQAPTFDNTIIALERAGRLLERVNTAFEILNATHTNDTLMALGREMAPRLSRHRDAIVLDERLFQRIRTLVEQRASLRLDADADYLLTLYHQDFVRAGAMLAAPQKELLRQYNSRLALLQQQFVQMALQESNASALVLDERVELAGMSNEEIEMASREAARRGLAGKFVIPLINTTQQSWLATLSNRATREKLLAASLARGSRGGPFDAREMVLEIVRLRAERAALLGYPNYAAYYLDGQTARTTDAVEGLLAALLKPALHNAGQEAAAIEQMLDEEGAGMRAAPHDWVFYVGKVRARQGALDVNALRPYLELERVLVDGVFYAAQRLYGITLRERRDLPVYHEEVRVFDVFDADGTQLAIFALDPYARPSKRGGAWAFPWVGQNQLLGTRPVVAMNLNIAKPAPGEPTLLRYEQVVALFHEFGHALHGFFSQVKYPRFAASRLPRDYIEFPSQVNEMWMTWPEVLANYARHYQTGEPMPARLQEKIKAYGQFGEGLRTTEYLATALLDQAWHRLRADQVPLDVAAFENQVLKQAGVDSPLVPPRYRSTYFSHSFSGVYSAGYYGYLWAEVLDADSVDWFIVNGGLSRKNGDHFRQHLLAPGGSRDPMQLYRTFRGMDATIGPLLKRRGLNPVQ